MSVLTASSSAAPEAATSQPSSAPQSAPATASNAVASTTPVESPWYAGFYNEKGDINQTAFEKMPEELKPYKDMFAQSKNINSLMMQMANLGSLAGKKGLAPLPEGASEQAKAERAALMRQINGVPEKPDLYGVKRPEDYPEEMWDDAYAGDILSVLHKHNAPPSLVKELFDKEISYSKELLGRKQAEAEAQQTQAREAEIAKLKETWKSPEEYAKMTDYAIRAIRTAGLDPEHPMFDSADAVKLAAFFGSRISEDKLIAPESSSGGSVAGSYARGMDIIQNPDNPMYKAYHDNAHPLHKQAFETVEAMFKAQYKR